MIASVSAAPARWLAAVGLTVLFLSALPVPSGDGAQFLASAPPPCPAEWRGLLGIYGGGDNVLLVLERDGALEAMVKGGRFYPLEVLGPDRFRFPNRGRLAARDVVFTRDASGRAVSLQLDEALLPRDRASDGEVVRFTPARPLDVLLREARDAVPPAEPPAPMASDLVDVSMLDPSVRVDLRYAGADNELGQTLVNDSRALLQRPAAEAVVRAHRSLAARGYGLVIRDAFHPWWVTRAVWEAAPPDLRASLHNPAQGSGYNRGTTVDVTLYRLADGATSELPSLYREMSVRAYIDFPGGTSEQRFCRDLLVEAMETQDLSSLSSQWWRYDLPGGRKFHLINEFPGHETAPDASR